MATTALLPPSPAPSTSSTNLARYAYASSGRNADPFNGSSSRDFCNSFWGDGDAGVKVLFARLRGAIKTTDGLRKFWQERAVIEEEYSNRLLELAKTRLGKDEIGDLRDSLDTLLLETVKQGATHLQLAAQIRGTIEDLTTELLKKQIAHRKEWLSPLEQRFADRQTEERVLVQAREKHTEESLRVAQLQQREQPRTVATAHHPNAELRRAQLAMHVAERAVANLTTAMVEAGPSWEREWRDFCDVSQDLEEERIDATKNVIWVYTDALSTVSVADDQACERVRSTLEQLDADLEIQAFVESYGTGNTLPDLELHVPSHERRSGSRSGTASPLPPSRRYADYSRVSGRAPQPYPSPRSDLSRTRPRSDTIIPRAPLPVAARSSSLSLPVELKPKEAASESASVETKNIVPPPPTTPAPPPVASRKIPPQSRRVSGPLPPRPSPANASAQRESRPQPVPPIPTPIPIPPTAPLEGQEGEKNKILFYVQALYEYKAAAPDGFNLEPGDVIAVTATPPDGWWFGELLDERRRIPGRNVFPSNYVTLF
ncbi:SH3 domain-containing protein [Mycena amicta]|nr:SH3 domain-containing protein [Mycena amicta]